MFKRNFLYFGAVGIVSLLAANCSSGAPDESVVLAESESALTAAQCMYFQTNGNVDICHKTGSKKNPFTRIRVDTEACVNGHTAHSGDFIALPGDTNCAGQGCLPVGAPCDANLPCCDGLSCTAGVCTAPNPCLSNPCNFNGDCLADGGSYTCSCYPGYTGANCDVDIDYCVSNPCEHGSCAELQEGYECSCDPGWTGVNCQINIDECAANPCAHGLCTDLVNAYACECDPGYTGTNCDELSSNCPCGVANPALWAAALSVADPQLDNCEFAVSPPYFDAGIIYNSTGSDVAAGGVFFGSMACGAAGPNGEIVQMYDLTEAEAQQCLAEIQAVCAPSTCSPNPCVNSTGCFDPAGVPGYTCECMDGWTGTNCEIAVQTCQAPQYVFVASDPGNTIDECEANPCVTGVCMDKVSGYQCVCKPGFGGNQCECQIP